MGPSSPKFQRNKNTCYPSITSDARTISMVLKNSPFSASSPFLSSWKTPLGTG